MFKPDLFSNPKPIFRAATEESSAGVAQLLQGHYLDLGRLTGRIFQSGAIELNSNNFLVELGERRYIVKRWSSGTAEEKHKRNMQAGLTNWLADQGIETPRIQRSFATDEWVVEHEGHCWCVLEYVEGGYFSGSGSEFLEIGEAIRRLFCALKQAPEHLRVNQTIEPPAEHSVEMMLKLEQEQDRWPAIFGAEARLLSQFWSLIKLEHSKVVGIAPALLSSIGLCHIDLHPHNVLMENGKTVAVLDFTSLVRAPLASILLFNLFKLARQAIVARGGDYRDRDLSVQRDKLLSNLLASGLIGADWRDRLALLAKVEIMRRLLYILLLNYEQGKRDWNHVLLIQIEALREAELVFS